MGPNVVNFHYIIGLTEVITETLEDLNQPNDSCPKKLFLIIPKSCDIRKSVADKDDKIKEVKTMHATHYGTSKRSYTFDMYKLRYEGKVLLSFHFF